MLQEVNVRIIAATNMNLEQAIKRRTFRQDLFYRLNVLPIHLPPLRERPDDVRHLLLHFIDNANREHSMANPCYLGEELIKYLSQYSWPGNVRQLKNLVDRLVIMKGGGMIEVSDLPPEVLAPMPMVGQMQSSTHLGSPHNISSEHMGQADESLVGGPSPFAPGDQANNRFGGSSPNSLNEVQVSDFDQQNNGGVQGVNITGRSQTTYPQTFGRLPENGLDLVGFIESLENDLIRQALERTGNNRNQAAKLLGLNRTTLVERIKKRRLAVLNEPSKEL
jgi:transcriptional regulator with PAS, ATPase and Fis domain